MVAEPLGEDLPRFRAQVDGLLGCTNVLVLKSYDILMVSPKPIVVECVSYASSYNRLIANLNLN